MHTFTQLLDLPTALMVAETSFIEDIKPSKDYNGPLEVNQSLLARWLREKHSLHVNVQRNMFFHWQVQVQDIYGPSETERVVDQKWLANDYGVYEAAMEAGLQHALTILKSLT